ncbi:hypothetical protein BH708_12805 [Brachybacterium sp. P6-10-X1]|uniref:ACT domain-containing protein n=1 Tax=Brachybacterium sp. P6-10-X1 TaxID=1903186 RepID=UPI00097187B0|nr:ACT domain-containing protein [Brachybacterium sp. P6-10-X1]APX33450.1 hypothetical protein BH708_12805 [Brachybacterium sp. P6-10-X1]
MPITDLADLLRSMRPIRQDGEYVFVDAEALPAEVRVEASVREEEGPSGVIARGDADLLGLPYDVVTTWITLTVHSSLEAVGLTAAVSTALAEAGLPCNVIAGLRHDHLLVPTGSADDALRVLQELSARSAHEAADAAG